MRVILSEAKNPARRCNAREQSCDRASSVALSLNDDCEVPRFARDDDTRLRNSG